MTERLLVCSAVRSINWNCYQTARGEVSQSSEFPEDKRDLGDSCSHPTALDVRASKWPLLLCTNSREGEREREREQLSSSAGSRHW